VRCRTWVRDCRRAKASPPIRNYIESRLRRIEHKLDCLAYAVTRLALTTRTPLLPSLPRPRRRSPLWPIVFRLLASLRLWDALLAAFCCASTSCSGIAWLTAG
jgi:hypothetical protein